MQLKNKMQTTESEHLFSIHILFIASSIYKDFLKTSEEKESNHVETLKNINIRIIINIQRVLQSR